MTLNLKCRGLQMKKGEGLPRQGAPFESILIRGKPSQMSGKNQWKKWKYLTSVELRGFMPQSLRPHIPELYDVDPTTTVTAAVGDLSV